MRKAGVLLPISSLPSKYGIGCISQAAYDFVDFLENAGQSYWQILPIGPTGYGDSPYQSPSVFAANPYFVSLEELIQEGLLTESECYSAYYDKNENYIDYKKIYLSRYEHLYKAYKRWNGQSDNLYITFISKHAYWLNDYALFMALKWHLDGNSWTNWTEDIRSKKSFSTSLWQKKLAEQIDFIKFIQFKFFTQWHKLKSYANKKGISIIGDIPIYTSHDSSDVWANPKLFQLDESGTPTFVAGCPPDGFSSSGQLWGNPIYNWSEHKKSGYEWWQKRISHCLDMFDMLRIDHFRGFDEFYAIPYGNTDAKIGEWKKGPGIELFKSLGSITNSDKIIAEDLGFITDSVKNLLRETGFAGIKVLEFAFDSRDNSTNTYLPHNYQKNSVVYTGTHDNQTLSGWLDTISEDELKSVREYLCDFYTPHKNLYKPLVALTLSSISDLCIIPIQDYLGLGDDARINTPSTIGTNWRWRMSASMINEKNASMIKNMCQTYGRS